MSTATFSKLGRHGTLTFVCLWFLVPAYLIVVNSFKPNRDILSNPLSFPADRMTVDAYRQAFSNESFDIVRAYLFSATITVTVVVAVIAVGSSIAFVIARSSSRWARAGYVLFLVGLMIPPQVTIIPIVQVLKEIGLIGTMRGLIIYDIAAYLPLAVFVFVNYIRTVPRELDESASMDGAGPLGTFWKVIFPVLLPATASVAVLLSVFIWNDFLNPLIILGPLGESTVTTGAYRAVGLYSTDWSTVFTYVCLSSAPMLVLFIVFQRFVVGGLTAGAVKG